MQECMYSSDDGGLLSNLAVQAAPAARVAQLVQQTLLPRTIPSLAGKLA